MPIVPLVLVLLFATGSPACAQVINGETTYDDTMLHRRPPDARAATQPSAAAPSRAEPVTADPPAPAGDRRD